MTHHVQSLLKTYRKDLGNVDQQKLVDCIEACFECGQTCTACADACLAEDMVAELRTCIRLNLDCADLCVTTGRMLSRQTGTNTETTRALQDACRAACAACGEKCAAHAEMHEHCRKIVNSNSGVGSTTCRASPMASLPAAIFGSGARTRTPPRAHRRRSP